MDDPNEEPIHYPSEILAQAESSGFPSPLVPVLRGTLDELNKNLSQLEDLRDEGKPVPQILNDTIERLDNEAHDITSDLAGDMSYQASLRKAGQ